MSEDQRLKDKFRKVTDEKLLDVHAIGVAGLKVWSKRSAAYRRCVIEVDDFAAEIKRRGLKPLEDS